MNLKHLFTNLNPFKKQEPQKPKVIEVIDGVEITDEPPAPINNHPKKREFTNQGKGSTWKLEEHDKQMIVSLWASGLTPSEVQERAREEFNIDISIQQILKYSKQDKWQPLIKKIRQETFSDIASVAGSHKKVRLERGEKVYEKAITKGKLDLALKATESQRKEMEGGGDTVNLTLNQFNVLSDEELEFKQKEVMERIKRLTSKGVTIEQSTNEGKATGS